MLRSLRNVCPQNLLKISYSKGSKRMEKDTIRFDLSMIRGIYSSQNPQKGDKRGSFHRCSAIFKKIATRCVGARKKGGVPTAAWWGGGISDHRILQIYPLLLEPRVPLPCCENRWRPTALAWVCWKLEAICRALYWRLRILQENSITLNSIVAGRKLYSAFTR